MMSEQDDRLLAVQRGREAVVLMGMLRPYIDGRVHDLVHQMVARYRQGTADLPSLLGIAAQVTCLVDLLSDLDNRAKRGDNAMKKEIDNAG